MRLVMFDMDGTLIDTGALIYENMTATFSAHGLAGPERGRAHAVIGLSLEKAMEQLAGVDETTAAALAVTYRQNYHALVAGGAAGDREPLYASARDTVLRLAAQDETLLGIATGKGLRGVHRILAQHDFAAHFSTLQTPDHNPSKPHPGMLLRAMDETGIAARDTVMIGDTTYDMGLAVAAGARAIGVTWGYHDRADLQAAGADIIIESFAQLDDAIERVLS